MELVDLAAAHEVAVKGAREVAAAAVDEGRLNLIHRIEIEDDTGIVVDTVHFGDVVKVEV